MKSESTRDSSTAPDIRERSFDFSIRIVTLCQALKETAGAGRILSNQLLRSGTSIGANIEEAHGSQSKADFVAKLSIACKEARETHYWLRLFAATKILPADRLEALTDEANQLIAILTTIVKKCRPGPKAKG